MCCDNIVALSLRLIFAYLFCIGLDSILFAINIDNAELNGGCQSEGEAKPDTGASGTLEPEAQVAQPTVVPTTGEPLVLSVLPCLLQVHESWVVKLLRLCMKSNFDTYWIYFFIPKHRHIQSWKIFYIYFQTHLTAHYV